MPAPYSLDLRRKIISVYKKESLSKTALAKRFQISRNCLYELISLYEETGEVLPQKHGGGTPPIMNEERLTFLKNLIKKQVDLRLEDLCLRFQEQFQVPIAVSTMSQNLIRYGVSRKKNMVLS